MVINYIISIFLQVSLNVWFAIFNDITTQFQKADGNTQLRHLSGEGRLGFNSLTDGTQMPTSSLQAQKAAVSEETLYLL